MKIGLLDILYPRKCVFCRELLRIESENWVCKDCLKEIEYITGNTCPRCGKPIEQKIKACYECRGFENFFTHNHALFTYEGMIRDAIRRFKYNRSPQHSKYFAEVLTNKFYDEIIQHDFLIGVPMYKAKIKGRGFNQADLLAKEISLLTSVPTLHNILLRTKNTKPQNALNRADRLGNLTNAFSLASNKIIEGKAILLVDDIYTTGSTINECARVLRIAGAKEVNSITISVVEYLE